MIITQVEYWDNLRKIKQYPSGGYYQDNTSELIKTEDIDGNNDIELFEKFYKMNNRLRYCNGSYFKFKDKEWIEKYNKWLNSDDYRKKSFNLYYGNGVVD